MRAGAGQAAGEDGDALDDAMRRHGRRVFSIALHMLGDAGEAEEVAQDVFLELYDALPRLHGEEHVQAWLRRVAVCRATDRLRRRKAAGPVLVDGAWDEERFAAPRAGSLEAGSGEERLFGGEESRGGMSARLEQMVLSLPVSMRAAVVLRYGQEMSPEEIAAATEQPLATVKSDLRRGLELLRRKAAVVLKEFVRA